MMLILQHRFKVNVDRKSDVDNIAFCDMVYTKKQLAVQKIFSLFNVYLLIF